MAALVVGADLRHLLDTPRLYGYSWDVMMGDGFGEASVPEGSIRAVARDPSIAATAAGGIGGVEVGGRSVGALGVDVIDGEIGPSIIEGRTAVRDDEIALGTHTMNALDVAIGDTVRVTAEGSPREMRVVGRAALPEVNDITSVDDGAAMTFGALRSLVPEEPRNVVLYRLERNVEPAELVDDLARLLGPYAEDFGVPEEALEHVTVDDLQPPAPTDLVDLGRIDRMPFMLAVGASLVAVAMLVHLLVSSVRARRRDLALLEVLGFTRRQVVGTVSWQASAIALVAVVVGTPLGVGLGQWLWRSYTAEVGVVSEVVLPIALLAVAVLAVLVIANVAAALSAWRLARSAPAVVLRTE
jgi:putative ABC transport system permease protein